jgi:uncharacterized membrane protein
MDPTKTVAIIGLMGISLIVATAIYLYNRILGGEKIIRLTEVNAVFIYWGCTIAVLISLLLLILTITFASYLVK